MKLIKQSVEYLPQGDGIQGIYDQIERGGRICYKSEPKGDSKAFVDMLIKKGHLSPLEHGTVYLKMNDFMNCLNYIYGKNPYSIINKNEFDDNQCYISTNYRVLVENHRLDDLKYLCSRTEHHVRRYTFKITTSIGIGRELMRHRKISFNQESTRYCNYASNKHGNELTFIIPGWYEQFKKDKLDDTGHRPDGTSDMFTVEDDFTDILKMSEATYNAMLTAGGTPQQARDVLPLATKTEIIATGTIVDWYNFLKLRNPEFGAKGVHPDMVELSGMIYDILKTETK